MELSIFQEYDQVLLGNKESKLNKYFFNSEYNEKTAIEIFRYALTYYLGWSADDIYYHLTYDVIKLMKLENLYKYIVFPCELNKEKDFYYIAILLFPKKYKLSRKELTTQLYKKILSGEFNKFPKGYMTGQLGMIRACFCLQYLISHNLYYNNIEELYETFFSPEGNKILKKYKLTTVCNDLFGHPLDFLHTALPNEYKNEYLYHYYRYIISEKQLNRQKLKDQKILKSESR